jgi:ABC-2 type transport system permease protein
MSLETKTAGAKRTSPKSSPVQMGLVNWIGVRTLYYKEVQRFLKVPLQTVLAPMMTTLLFLAIFTLAFGSARKGIGDIPYSVFLAPGLIMMAVIQNSFANTSSSLMISKVQGNIVDLLMPPLSSGEITFAISFAGLSRGVIVAIMVAIGMKFFVDISVHSWFAVIFYVLGAGMMLSLLGMIGGIIAEKFDHMAAITNFVIMPLSFLSGTFYSVERLSGIWYELSLLNPFFYMIDGLRYGFTGHSDGSLIGGAITVFVIDVLLYIVVLTLFRRGYRLKP